MMKSISKIAIKIAIRKGKARPFDINGDGSIDFRDITAIFTGERAQPEKKIHFLEQRVRQIWAKNEHHFTLLSVRIQKRERQTRSLLSWVSPFGKDKKVKKTLLKILNQFEDHELNSMRTTFVISTDKLKAQQGQLADVRASMAMHPVSGQGKYERTIKKIELGVSETKVRIQDALSSFRGRMNDYGVELSDEQAVVLLSRIDADDVTKMSSVFSVISSMTRQFAETNRETAESIEVAKKYYGIYIGLLELQTLIQTEYLKRIDNVYLTGVARIGNDARKLAADTRAILKTASSDHSSGYRQNLDSQEFTISVTEMYEDALRADREKVVRARAIVEELLKLAENTLGTVRVSADLISLVRQSEGMYQEVMSLQTPDLVPFENLELQREFEAVTGRLRSSA